LAQAIDVRVVRDPAVEDYDFTWVYWFETQGRGYLREAVADETLPWDTPATRRWRGEVVAALLPLVNDRDAQVRAAAVLALARMGEESLAQRLLPGAVGVAERGEQDAPDAQGEAGEGSGLPTLLLLDPSPDVRLAAWVALGLLDLPQTRAVLSVEPMEGMDELSRCAQAAAIGLLGELDRSHVRWLVSRMDDVRESLEVKRWCVWALSQHDDAALDPVFDAALVNLPSPFIIGQVLQNRGFVARKGGADWLVSVLRYDPRVREWAGYRALSGLPAAGYYGSTPRRLGMETRIASTITLAGLPLIERDEDRRRVLELLRYRMLAGNSSQAMDFNRGFDTIAYFMHCDLTTENADLLYDQLRGITALSFDDPAVQEGLEEGEVPDARDLLVRQSANESRAYAALAAGLLIRRATEGTFLSIDRPLGDVRGIEIERLKRRFGIRLMRAVADEREPVSYRAACALALGLSGDRRYSAELAAELQRLRGGDEAVLGYGLLALAMLGEDRASEPALRYLTRPGRVMDMDDLLGRRAALQALGLIGQGGDEATRRALVGAWGGDRWVSLSVAEATAWAGRYDAVPAMLESLGGASPSWRATAAQSLGVVFDQAFPSRLSPLIEMNSPVMSFRSIDADNDTQENEDDAILIEDEQPELNPTDPQWPMRRLHALGGRFVIDVMRRQE